MHQQDLTPIGDSIALSALCAAAAGVPVDPDRRAEVEGADGRGDGARRRRRSGGGGVRDAGRPGRRRGRPRRRAGRARRPLAHVQGDLDLQAHRRVRPLRGPAPLLQHHQRRPARPGGRDRVRRRRPARGAGGRRRAGRGLCGDADRARLPPAEGGSGLPAGQHRAGRLRRHGQSDDGHGGGHGPARRGRGVDGRAPGPVPSRARPVRARAAGRRPLRRARDLAGRARGRRDLRHAQLPERHGDAAVPLRDPHDARPARVSAPG